MTNKKLDIIIKCIIVMLIIMLNIVQYVYANDRIYTIDHWDTIKLQGLYEGNAEKYWTGFRRSHYGMYPPSTAYKGQTISQTYTYKMIGPDGVLRDQSSTVDTQMIGYGYYAFDYRKHILGLLYYIKDKIATKDYDTDIQVEDGYEYIDHVIGNSEDGDATIQRERRMKYRKLPMTEVCDVLSTEILLNNYDSRYRDTTFIEYYKKSFLDTKQTILKELENEFYLKAYGKNAIKYLTSTFGIKPELAGIYAPAIRGAIWSIMEERYRRKNLAGKTNLELKVEAGEVLPFLLYINCDYDDSDAGRTYSDIRFEKRVEKNGKIEYNEYDTNGNPYPIDIDQVIDGAYQYMVYYYAKEDANTNTVFSNDEEDSDYDSMSDFKEEYEELTRRPFPVLRGKELDLFLKRVAEKKAIYKKSKQNSLGSFGIDEEYNIESDINYSQAMKDMKKAMEDTIGLVAFNGMQGEENIARTYLMSKNIIDSNRVRDEYSYYDISTNVITRTPGQDDNHVLLSDFQKVELDRPIFVAGEGRTHEDTDNDGIYDGNELDVKRPIDITYFVWKTLYAEVFGNQKETPENRIVINNLINQYKVNVANVNNTSRENNCYEYNFDWNGDIDPYRGLTVEVYGYRSNPTLKDTDFDGIDDGKGEEALAKLEREKEQNLITYDMMKNDEHPLSNHFVGKMHSTRLSGDEGIEVDMTMDYRYFLMNNRNYYDELSTMSLLYANSIYQQGIEQAEHSGIQIKSANNFKNNTDTKYTTTQIQNMDIDKFNNLQIKGMMEHFGFKDVNVYYMGNTTDDGYDPIEDTDPQQPICREYKDTHKGSVAIGYKNIEYHGIDKTVVGIVIRGTAEDDDWDSDFDMGDLRIKELIDLKGKNYEDMNTDLQQLGYDTQYREELNHFIDGYDDWTHRYHHAGFDIVANRVIEILREYMDRDNDMNGDICFWVTGHSMGAGVANIVAAELLHGTSGINNRTDNVFCYTFAAPNTFYLTDNVNVTDSVVYPGKKITESYREPHGIKYRCIFNVVNDDDFVPKLPMEECEWTRYGRTAKLSIEGKVKPVITKDKEYYEYIKNQYKSNILLVDGTIASFNSMFPNTKNAMRKDTYTFNYFNPTNYVMTDGFQNGIVGIPNNSIPYQKSIATIQHQTPAYFMQCIAHSMHEYTDTGEIEKIGSLNKNKLLFASRKFASRYVAPKYITLITGGGGFVENPHMLESYYVLSKEINTTDFR